MTIAEILQEFTDHGFEDTSTATKMIVINDTVWDIESRVLWPWMHQKANLTLTASDQTPTMPTGFFAVKKLVIPSESIVLQPEEEDFLQNIFTDDLDTLVQDPPRFYYFVGDELRLYPIPATTLTGKLSYIRQQTELTDTGAEADIFMPPRHHRVIVLGSLQRLYIMEDDIELAAGFEDMYENRIQRMIDSLLMKNYDRPKRIYVSDWDEEWM